MKGGAPSELCPGFEFNYLGWVGGWGRSVWVGVGVGVYCRLVSCYVRDTLSACWHGVDATVLSLVGLESL